MVNQNIEAQTHPLSLIDVDILDVDVAVAASYGFVTGSRDPENLEHA